MTDQEIKDAIEKNWEEIRWIETGKTGLLRAVKIILEETK